MMPELRRHYRGQTHLHGKPRQGTGRQTPKSAPPMMHRRDVKITGLPQRFFTQELRDEGWLRFKVEAVQRRPEDRFPPPADRRRQPALGQKAQQMFIPKPTEFPIRMQARQEIEDLLVEEGIPHLHRGMHGDAIPFPLQQVSSQGDARRDPDAAIQRVPAFGAFDWKSQIHPGIEFLQHFAHWRSIEPKLGEPEQPVRINPGVRAADGFFHPASKSGRILWHLEHPKIGAPCTLAGYPEVTAYQGNKVPVGAAAGRDQSVAARSIVLAPGQTAHATLDAAVPAARCGPVRATGLRVVTPGQKGARYVRRPLTACTVVAPDGQEYLRVRAIQAGTGTSASAASGPLSGTGH